MMVQVWSILPLNEVFSLTLPLLLLEQHSSAFVFWNISI